MTVLLGVDWGSSSVRVLAIGADGGITHAHRADDGVFTGAGAFEERLQRHLGDWLGRWPDVPILLCGMVGSDRGWVHAPYASAPAGIAQIAAALTAAPFARPAFIVPGVSFQSGETCEVMRGEETLLLGLADGFPDAALCLPGTHSKWVDLSNGGIASFRTYLTGELRASLLTQGALAVSDPQVRSPDAFRAGLDAARENPSLGRALFQARARRLLGRLPPEHTASFVSGVLIGAEIAAEPAGHVLLAARGVQAEEYGEALAQAGRPFTVLDPEPLAASALLRIARAAGLVRPLTM